MNGKKKQMSSLKKKSDEKFLLELDALIAYSSSNDRLHDEVSQIFDYFDSEKIEFEGKVFIASSAMLEYTLLLRSSNIDDDEIADTLTAWENFPHLFTKELNARSIINSAVIRDECNLSFFDSLHAGTALTHNLTLIGSDTAYSQVNKLKTVGFEDFYNSFLK